ncbi:MAG: hypothetical protein HYZ75_12680 [Elusimicrobia bacterium]|nr:hypothetical protein [Elusimicrobiota bacterium]
MVRSTTAALVLLLAGCVTLPSEYNPPSAALPSEAGFTRLDPGSQKLVSLHFETSAYTADGAKAASETAETLYRKIMEDTGLYSFMPRELYPLVVYSGQDEYLRKTGMPAWSGGVSVGRAVYMPDSPQFRHTLAHEMTHLIFNEFMVRPDPSQRWINEGMAVYEEEESRGGMRMRPGTQAIPFREMVSLAPIGERDVVVGDWYRQVGSVVRFMIERGGKVGFGEFLKAVRDGRPLDEAVRTGFPGNWASAAALEAAWTANR